MNNFESFKLELSNELQGDFGELAFKHFCHLNKFAYIRLEKIFKTFKYDNILEFKFKNRLIKIEIPKEIAIEVWDISNPSNGKENIPTYVFDYFTVCLKHYFEKDKNDNFILDSNNSFIRNNTKFYTDAFSWVEIKTGQSKLTDNQKNQQEKSKIGVKIFRIDADFPMSINIIYENRKK